MTITTRPLVIERLLLLLSESDSVQGANGTNSALVSVNSIVVDTDVHIFVDTVEHGQNGRHW
jgi:hypothetical protein